MSALKGLVSKGTSGLSRVLQAVFGRWQWESPPWLRAVGNSLNRFWLLLKRRPKTSMSAGALIVLIGVAGVFGYRWYLAQPKPVYPQCVLKAPDLTRWQDDKPKIFPVVLTCNESVAPLAAVGKAVATGIDLKPKVAGQWVWETDRRLVFTPANDWPIGQKFSVTLTKQHVVAPQIHLEQHQYDFSTAPFTAEITESQFYQDPQDPALKKMVATVHFSHSVNPEEFEQHTTLKLAKDAAFLGLTSDAVLFTVNYDKRKLNAYVHSHSLGLPRENTPMTLTLKKGIHASKGGDGTLADLTSSITIPGRFSLRLNEFSMILADNEKLEPEQILLFRSDAPVPDSALDKHISAWVLPEQHPDPKINNNSKHFYWSEQQVDKQILASAEPLSLSLIPSDDPEKKLHTYRFLAPVGKYIFVKIDGGITAIGGTQTAEAVTKVMQVIPYKHSLKLMGDGALLGLNGERKIGLVARSVDGVKIEIGRLLPNQLHQLLAVNDGGFKIPYDYYDTAEDRLVERFVERRPFASVTPGKPIYDNVDLSSYFKPENQKNSKLGVFLVRISGLKTIEGKPDFDESSYRDAKDSRLLLVTDLGLITKRNLDGTQEVFVQSIAKGGPLAGVTLELIGRNGLSLESRTTDASGYASFPKLSEKYDREKTPLLIIARQGDDMSFLPINKYDRNLNFSRFDIGGIDTKLDPKSLSAFVFSDRGMYRPGEDIHLGSILRTQDWKTSLDGIPLIAEITDPRGRVVSHQNLNANNTGFNEIQWKTQVSAPTGTYSVSIYLLDTRNGNKFLGSTNIRVQEFEPDRLKVSANLSPQPVTGWLTPEQVAAKVIAMNLFGTPATDRRVSGEITLSPAIPNFGRYPDYRFYDPRTLNESQTQNLPDSKTDDKGQASFDLNLSRFAKATYKLSLIARVFEPEGGRNVAAVSDALVSSAPYLVGVKKTDADVAYITKDSKQSSQWQAISPDLNGLALEGLTLEWVQRKYVSVLVKQNNGTYRYQSRLKETVRDSHPQTLAAKGSDINLPTAEPGEFALVLRDKDGQELNRLQYSVVGLGNLSRSLERSAELQIKLNKTEYVAGDTIELSIQAPYTGAGLITIERDKVYSHQWFKTDTTSSVQHITIPADFEGNGYITVQYVRGVNSDEIFTSPLSYGAVPFKMSLAQRTQQLEIKAPALVKPGEDLQLELHGTRTGKAVVYAVDEGILQVARYQKPDPLGFFFQKRRLEVESSQILDLLLPEFSQLLKASAPGGDGDDALARHLNPFKNKHKPPVAYWSGLVDVTPEGTKLTYKVPDYFNGKLHVYAVAVDADSVGVNDGNTEVRGDLIISPNVPLMLSPGDEVEVSYGLANNLKQSSGPIDVKLTPSEHLEIVGDTVQHLAVDAGKEGKGVFKVRAKDSPGAATLVFSATIAGSKARLEEGLSVRPAVPYRTSIAANRTSAKQAAVNLTRSLYDPFRSVSFTAAYTPLAWTKGCSNTWMNTLMAARNNW